jgi:hypothetical protein
MTTSKTMHNALLALSKKVKKKKQDIKQQRPSAKKDPKKDASRFVELARAVLHSSSHHVTKPTVTSASTSGDNQIIPGSYDSYYPKRRQQLAQQIKQLQQQRQQVVEQQVKVWDVYKYGLEKISNLNDLRDAPDAIMPGNFPPLPLVENNYDDNNNEQAQEQQVQQQPAAAAVINQEPAAKIKTTTTTKEEEKDEDEVTTNI